MEVRIDDTTFLLSDRHVRKSGVLSRVHAAGAHGQVQLSVSLVAFEHWLNGAERARMDTETLIRVFEVCFERLDSLNALGSG